MEEITAQKDQLEAGVRSRVIVRTSVIGIAANVLRAAFKAVIEFASNSIAITMDAANNLSDALFDAVLSLSTLVAAVVFLVAGVAIEAWVGTLISVFIVKGGLEMLGGAINQILGERADAELAREVKRAVAADPDANGAFDLELHAYGPEQIVGSVHTEVPDTVSAGEIDEMSRRIQDAVYAATDGRVLIAAVGIYFRDTTDSTAKQMRSEIIRMVMAHEGVLQLHGFYVDAAARELRFDVILDSALPNREATYRQIRAEVQVAYPDFTLNTFLDVDVTD